MASPILNLGMNVVVRLRFSAALISGKLLLAPIE
jgi:hypothetical protein